MNSVYITKIAKYLPGKAISNEEMEEYLGYIHNAPSKAKSIILRNNGIKSRYYAIDKNQKATETNADMTKKAIEQLFDSYLTKEKLEVMSCGTTTADQIQPSHASMVHGVLNPNRSLEINTSTGLCNAGMSAFKYAYMSIKSGNSKNAVCSGSERVSTWLTADKFNHEAENLELLEERPIIAFKREFLRWMLSDGAGAFLLENTPRENSLNLRVEFIDFYSYAHELETCMYSGCEKMEDGTLRSWAEFPPEEWLKQSIFSVKQDTRLLGENILKKGAEAMRSTFDKHQMKSEEIDYILAHISSMYFREGLKEELNAVGLPFSEEKWFYNLTEVGNVGSASIYLALEALFNSNQLKKGQKILLCVPESGRFSYAITLLTVV